MKITEKKLKDLGIQHAVFEDELYFEVLAVKENFPDKKFPPDKIKSLPIGSIYVNTIKISDIEDMTEFDKNMVEFMKAKSKE